MKSKRCNRCGYTKEESEFNKNRSSCKVCERSIRKQRTAEKKRLLVEYKGNRCQMCGIDGDPVIYDFHHIDRKEKEFTVGDNMGKSLEKLKIEVDKCMLLCSNCHRMIHKEC